MADIKIKNKQPKNVKSFDKARAWTERVKDPIVYANKKINDTFDKDKTINEYSNDRMKFIANRTKDETIYVNKKVLNSTKRKAKNYYSKRKTKEERSNKDIINNNQGNMIKGTTNSIKTTDNVIKSTEKVEERKVKFSKRVLEQGKKLAMEGSKKVANGSKKIAKSGVSAVKGIMKALKSLITVITASSLPIFIIILVFSIACIIVGSVFGIFLSSENLENSIKMSDCIAELNDEMDNKVSILQKNGIYDAVVINSNRASWKDILAIYAVRVSDGDTEKDVITMDKEKKKILKEVFWDMNTINHNNVVEEYETDSIGTLDSYDLTDVGHNTLPTYSDNSGISKKRVLHININSKAINDIMKKYNFTEKQKEQYLELTSEENEKLWYGVIYGNYRDNGEITEWKQGGKEWSNIKIGTTNKTIGGIGCLTTSVAILIKKSGVATPNIYPFNPGTFVISLNNNYGFDKHGNLSYKAISKAVPNFQYVGTVYLKGMSKSQKIYEIQKYAEKGYYLAIEVKGATKNSQHWVALDSISGSNILMLDPSVGNNRDMWSKYDWQKTSQFIYFRAIK